MMFLDADMKILELSIDGDVISCLPDVIDCIAV